VCWSGALAWDAFYRERWSMLAGAFVVGLLFTLADRAARPALRMRGAR
jgi:hypothetical protein